MRWKWSQAVGSLSDESVAGAVDDGPMGAFAGGFGMLWQEIGAAVHTGERQQVFMIHGITCIAIRQAG